jgi:hypothetical protein
MLALLLAAQVRLACALPGMALRLAGAAGAATVVTAVVESAFEPEPAAFPCPAQPASTARQVAAMKGQKGIMLDRCSNI